MSKVISALEHEITVDEYNEFKNDVIQEFLKENARYDFCFIDKEVIENIWFSETAELPLPDEDGYVILKPLMHYEECDTLAGDLVPISKEDAIRLIHLIDWKEYSEYELTDEYREEVSKILKNKI